METINIQIEIEIEILLRIQYVILIASLGVSYSKNLPSSPPTSTTSKSKYREKMKKYSVVGMD